MNPIVDTHQHLWDLTQLHLPWLDGGGPLAKSHTPEDYQRESEGLNVVKTVYMEVDVEPAQKVAEATYVLGLCADPGNPMTGAVIGGNPAEEGFVSYIAQFAGNPYLKGVRQVLHGGMPVGTCLQPLFRRHMEYLASVGLRFDLCLRSTELLDGAQLAALCPSTRFILDHCGNADPKATDRSQWEDDITEVAKQPNVLCKISGIVAGARPGAWTPDDLAPIILHCAEVFGPDRIMFASDWPVCTLTATYRQWVEALQSIVADWSETDRRKLFHDNAVRFYEL
ncbi:MAG: Amidohydrolase [Chthonomonadales bacterium]|nr:Amidohydrolase [Chthonomonadales bacterium]